MNGAMKLIRAKLVDRVEDRTFQGADIALELHDTAPRGGTNVNAYGQQRSAPGEQPAIEHGDLREAILNGNTVDEATATGRFIANTVHLEYGTVHIAPRPMGRMTIDKLKQEVQGGS